MAEPEQRIETPRHQKMVDFRRRRLPAIVWSLAAVLCAFLLLNRAGEFEYIGMAQALEYEVSSQVTGTVETLVVELFDDVEAGEMLAKLDDSQVVAVIETSQATVRQLAAELEATKVQLLSDNAAATADLRRFQIDEEQRRLDALSLRVVIESDEVEAERLALEVRRAQRLLDNGLISEMEFDNFRLLHDQLRRRVEENRVLLAETEQDYLTAKSRRESYENSLPHLPAEEPLLLPLKNAIAVESGRMREIELQREALVLRSPVSGQISQLLCRRGQSVVPGEPILMVAERSAREILAYLGEGDGTRVVRDSPVLVSSRNDPSRVAESRVVRVSPTIQALPQRLWRDPRTPDYGRSVIIAGVDGLDLTPGELVNVKLIAHR